MLKKHDLVICLETGEMGEILAVFSISRIWCEIVGETDIKCPGASLFSDKNPH